MECFSIDESGYTGFDLLNAEQPMQGATAVAIPTEDAARLIQEFFQSCKRRNLSFTRSLGELLTGSP